MIRPLNKSDNLFQQGFTLFEILISLALLSMLAFAIVTITKQSTQTRDEVTKEDNDLLKVYNTLQILQWDFAHYYNPLLFSPRLNLARLKPMGAYGTPPKEEEMQRYQEMEQYLSNNFRNNAKFSYITESGLLIPRLTIDSDQQLTFMTQGYRRKNHNEKSSLFSWVTYQIEDPTKEDLQYFKETYGEENIAKIGKNLTRKVSVQNSFGTYKPADDLTTTQVVMEHVISILWQYWDPAKKKFTELTSYNESMGPITSFKITLKYFDLYQQEKEVSEILPTFYQDFDPSRFKTKLNDENGEDAQDYSNPISDNTEGGEE